MQLSNTRRYVILILLSIIAGMVYLTPFLRFTFYDQMLVALAIDDVQLGTIGATYGLFNVIGYIPSGFLSERFSTKTMLIVSCLGMMVCTIWYATFPPFWALVVIHALYGIFSVGTFWSSYLKTIRSLGTDAEQGKMFGMSEGIRGLGNCVTSFVCLGIIGAFAQVAMGFGVLLWVNVAVFALLAVLVVFLIPKQNVDTATHGEAVAQEEKQGSLTIIVKMLKMLKRPGVWICIFVIFCGYALWNTVNGYMGTYCTRVLGIPEEWSSALSIIRSYLIVFIAGVSGGLIIDRFKTKGSGMMAAYIAMAIVTALVFVTSGFSIVCLVMTLVVAYVANVIKGTYWSILGDAGISPADTGTATAIISVIGLTPDIFTPAIIAQFIDYGISIGNINVGFDLMFAWMIAFSAAGVVAGFILKKYKKHLDAKGALAE